MWVNCQIKELSELLYCRVNSMWMGQLSATLRDTFCRVDYVLYSVHYVRKALLIFLKKKIIWRNKYFLKKKIIGRKNIFLASLT